jgi:1,4-alpha-glucan branching enzyme
MAEKTEKGCLALLLHAHLPFVRHPEHDDSLEENWLFDAITESYVPLLLALDRLVADGVDFRLNFSLTPTLAAMLEDDFLQNRYGRRLERLRELAGKELVRTRSQPEFHTVAMFYDARLVRQFRRLQDLGRIEVLASAATHGYLPLLAVNPSAVRRQIRVGIEAYRRAFGREPQGFWLPECGYAPGLDEALVAEGIRYTVLETHGLTRADPRPRHGVYAPLRSPAGLTIFGRDPDCSKQVWSSREGYPGDFDYREFYRDVAYDLEANYVRPYIHRDGIRIDTGLKYYRITGHTDQKQVYAPAKAAAKVQIHAGHFLESRCRQIEPLAAAMDTVPIVTAPYDAELFGHWWFEGPLWLESLLRQAARQQTIRLVTLSEYSQEHPASEVAAPAVSSWGYKGFHEMWLNGKTDWIYPHLHRAAEIVEKLEARYGGAEGLPRRALEQAQRELLLAQASDWPFIISSGTMVEYAAGRIKTHLLRLEKLRQQVESGAIDAAWLASLEQADGIFRQ